MNTNETLIDSVPAQPITNIVTDKPIDVDIKKEIDKPKKPPAKLTRQEKKQKKLQQIHITDHLKTANYLYQVSNLLQCQNNIALGKHYTKAIKEITLKTVTRINSEMKETICKKCFSPLIPGLSSKVRISNRREQHIITTCSYCEDVRRLKLKKLKKELSTSTN